jgi:polyhydroxybutyrate depolymerase
VAGALNLDSFAPTRPVAVLHIHSVDDPRAVYGGGLGPPFPGTNVRSSHRPVMDGLEAWRTRNRCSDRTRVVEARSGTAAAGGAKQTATLVAWDGCAAGASVMHWKLTGVGHGWPGSRVPELREEIAGPSTRLVNAAEEIWTFFAGKQR